MEHSASDSGPLTDNVTLLETNIERPTKRSRRIDRLYLAFASITIVIWLLLFWVLF